MRGSHRWEVLMAEDMADEELYNNKAVEELLVDERVLGPSYTMLEMGGVLSDAGATAGHWHYDDDYLFGDDVSFANTGVAGHDLPPYCVTMMVAVTNVTYEQGPTEFCLGSSHLKGLDAIHLCSTKVSLGSVPHTGRLGRDGPPRHWRAPFSTRGHCLV